MRVSSGYRALLGGRDLASVGTNAGSTRLPFQDWRKFKEAFAPELIGRAVMTHPNKVQAVLDPFGGSGTTALASRLLGIHPTTVEVNPYLADLIEAKLSAYDPEAIGRDLSAVLARASRSRASIATVFKDMPKTFIEPGVDGRWLFGLDLAAEAAGLRRAVDRVENEAIQRLFRVLLGSVLVETSNIIVSGKGRRYRQNWAERRVTRHDLRRAFVDAVSNAVRDIVKFAPYLSNGYRVLRGDSRSILHAKDEFDLAIFSPPYPNSFDYTDVYNVELWMLGYLGGPDDNRQLRAATLSSHVQLLRPYTEFPGGSTSLNRTMERLNEVGPQLWNSNIPKMVGSYFAELIELVCRLGAGLRRNGRQWLVVGDSRYAGVTVPVATILSELARSRGIGTERVEAFRSMRAAPQQGGRPELSETLLILAL